VQAHISRAPKQHPSGQCESKKASAFYLPSVFGAPFFHKYNNISTRAASFFPLNNGPHTKTRRAAAFCNSKCSAPGIRTRVVAPLEGLAASITGERYTEMLPLPPLPVCRLSNFNIYKIVQWSERSRYSMKKKSQGSSPWSGGKQTKKYARRAHLSDHGAEVVAPSISGYAGAPFTASRSAIESC